MAEVIKAGVDANFTKYMMGADLTPEEKDIVTTIVGLRANDEVDVIIPADITDSELAAQTVAICKVYSRMLQAGRKCRPAMGRFFKLIHDRSDADPDFLKANFGCNSFTHFMDWFVPTKFKMQVSEGWACLQLARGYPDLTSDEYEQRGMQTKLKMISKAIPLDNGRLTPEVQRARQELVNVAKTVHSAEDMAAAIETKGYRDAESVMPYCIKINCSKALGERWNEFLKDYKVKAYFGHDYLVPAKVFEVMLAEFQISIYNAISMAKNL